MERITVFTPTFNRAHVLHRVYDSLMKQTYKNFKWIIVDDGSIDNTKEVVEKFKLNCFFDIEYYYQENSGKHVAINNALKYTNSEFFLIADSDDSFEANSLEVFINAWDVIPDNEKEKTKGIICRSKNAETGEVIGKFPSDSFFSNDLDAFFILKLNFEKWQIIRTDVMKEFPFPEPEEKLKFYPETVVWWQMAKKYNTKYISNPLRLYYHDQDNSLVKKGNNRCRESRYLWLTVINDVGRYFFRKPLYFIKAYIGYARDSHLANVKLKKALIEIHNVFKRILCLGLYPFGFLLSVRRKQK